METAFTLSLKLPDDADPEVVARALSDFLDDAPFSAELREAIASDDPDAPFDGITVDVDERAPEPEPTPLQALRADDGWLALLLALMVRTEKYLHDIPMLGVRGRAEGRDELLALIVPTITRAEELASTVDADGSVREALRAVLTELELVDAPATDTNQED